jgi:ABC-2 type transport system ATP-binding protein
MSLTPRTPILSVKNLSIRYPQSLKPAVDNISFDVFPGEVLGILGGNGAGKTSSLKAIAGVLPYEKNTSILVNGYQLTNLEEKESARSLIGYCPDTGGLIRQATVEDHISLILANNSDINNLNAYGIVEKMGLAEHIKKEAGSFSHGMSRRLSVVLATLNAKKLLILDEPFDGVDPLGVEAIQEIIGLAKSEGLGIIISTHLLSLLAETSDRILVMNRGRVIAEENKQFFTNADASNKYAELLKLDNNKI